MEPFKKYPFTIFKVEQTFSKLMWEIGLWSVLLLKSFNAFKLDFGAFFGQGLLRNPSQIRFSICAILIKKALFTHVVVAWLALL